MTPLIIHTSSRPWYAILWEMIEYRSLLFVLTSRNIKLRYRQTGLGILWVIFQPLSTAAIFASIFGKIAHLSSEGIPYILFSFSGVLPWLFISQCMQRGSTSLVSDIGLITKVYFPRFLIPFSTILSVGVDILIALAAVFVLMPFYHFAPNWQLLAVPLFLLLMLLFSIGLTLIFSAISVYYRDFVHITPLIVQLWLYASPIAYSSSMLSIKWKHVYNLNPLTGIIEGFRWAVLGLPTFPWHGVCVSIFASILICALGMVAFQRMEGRFADVI